MLLYIALLFVLEASSKPNYEGIVREYIEYYRQDPDSGYTYGEMETLENAAPIPRCYLVPLFRLYYETGDQGMYTWVVMRLVHKNDLYLLSKILRFVEEEAVCDSSSICED